MGSDEWGEGVGDGGAGGCGAAGCVEVGVAECSGSFGSARGGRIGWNVEGDEGVGGG